MAIQLQQFRKMDTTFLHYSIDNEDIPQIRHMLIRDFQKNYNSHVMRISIEDIDDLEDHQELIDQVDILRRVVNRSAPRYLEISITRNLYLA